MQKHSGSLPLIDSPAWVKSSTLNARRVITTMRVKAMAFSPGNMVAGRLSFLRFLTTGALKAGLAGLEIN